VYGNQTHFSTYPPQTYSKPISELLNAFLCCAEIKICFVEFLEAMGVNSKRGTGWEADDHSKNGYWLIG
jgi:hypothetical protein